MDWGVLVGILACSVNVFQGVSTMKQWSQRRFLCVPVVADPFFFFSITVYAMQRDTYICEANLDVPYIQTGQLKICKYMYLVTRKRVQCVV